MRPLISKTEIARLKRETHKALAEGDPQRLIRTKTKTWRAWQLARDLLGITVPHGR